MENTAEKLQIIFGDATLGVKGEDFRYIFSYATGGLESLHVGGKEWLYRTPKPTFWRAVTDNDRGNGFPCPRFYFMHTGTRRKMSAKPAGARSAGRSGLCGR